MTTIVYRLADGSERQLDVRESQSVMEGAIRNGVPGILAECGGSCMCATCHVYVEGGPADALPPMSEDEDVMLGESIAPRRDNSRLSCQIKASSALDGLIVRIAENG